jgi:radical S-adenosyl methionine domain-containing protein 2
LIGRHRNGNQIKIDDGKGNDHLESLERVRGWCRDYRVAFKINSVINVYNVDEDMNDQIQQLNPVRWKVVIVESCVVNGY